MCSSFFCLNIIMHKCFKEFFNEKTQKYSINRMTNPEMPNLIPDIYKVRGSMFENIINNLRKSPNRHICTTDMLRHLEDTYNIKISNLKIGGDRNVGKGKHDTSDASNKNQHIKSCTVYLKMLKPSEYILHSVLKSTINN